MVRCRMTEKELKDFYEKVKVLDHKEDHRLAFRTLTNPLRRDILYFIEYKIIPTYEIKKKFNLDETQVDYNLNMLKQTIYIIDSEEGWKLTPRGIGFIENAQLSD